MNSYGNMSETEREERSEWQIRCLASLSNDNDRQYRSRQKRVISRRRP